VNGLNSTNPISTIRIAAAPPYRSMLGPPNRPNGPRTGCPCSSTQNDQPAGADDQDSSGPQRFGGRQRAFGGSGQPGGALNCLTLNPLPEVVQPPQPRQPLGHRTRGYSAVIEFDRKRGLATPPGRKLCAHPSPPERKSMSFAKRTFAVPAPVHVRRQPVIEVVPS
jgi:hypothetical protein